MAIGVARSQSCGGLIARGYLTNFSSESVQPTKRRGPRTLLQDDELFARREQLLIVFEELWGEIGWNLHKAKTPADITRALSPLQRAQYLGEIGTILYREPAAEALDDSLDDIRSQLRRVEQDYQKAGQTWSSEQDRFGRIQAALALDKDPTNERAETECLKAILASQQECQQLLLRRAKLKNELDQSEASIARGEVLRFCRSKRYELNPVNLANAVAGLPFMGWRQSMRRCTAHSLRRSVGTDYQIFKAIRYMTKGAKRSSEAALVDSFRDAVPRLRAEYRTPREALAREWLFLERALRRAFASRPHPKALPFEITKYFFAERCSRSPSDNILAPAAALQLAARGKTSKRSATSE